MATIKSFTSLEQSKKLAEILPLESADMCINSTNPYMITHELRPYDGFDNEHDPSWSLAALLGVLPNPKVYQAIGGYWCCECWKNAKDVKGDKSTYIGCTKADNPIDACYEMILKLKEENLL